MNPDATPYWADPTDRSQTEQPHGVQSLGPDGRLAELRQLTGYRIADGDPDIRGWEVKTAASFGERTVGTVEDLLVELDTMRVRYMVVCLDKNAVATSRDRRILVPVGIGRLDEQEDRVRLDGFTSGQLVGVPEFRPGKLTRHYEANVRRRFASAEPKAGARNRHTGDFYDYGEFDDRSFWGTRRRGREDVPYLTRHD
jgi:photosynthetic reaction center H subunit